MTDLFRELPFEDDDLDAAAQAITEAMGVDLPVDSLQALLRRTRHAHRMVLSEFLRRNDPAWKPPRRLKDNVDPDGPDYDYGEDAGVGLDDVHHGDWRRVKGKWKWVDFGTGWDGWWKLNWGKPPGNPGLFRGTDVPAPPLVAIYHLVNRWWRAEMRLSFHPDFVCQHSAATDAKRFPDLNRAAQIFTLVAQDCDPSYTVHLCALVNEAYYKRLDRSFPRPS